MCNGNNEFPCKNLLIMFYHSCNNFRWNQSVVAEVFSDVCVVPNLS